jgi:hypothetical protein
MGGGKSKEKKVAPVTAPVFDTQGFQGPGGYQQFRNQGYQPTPQTFTQAGRPSWMQGHFAMPSWGMRADDPTKQVTPAMLDPRTAMFAQRDAYNGVNQGDGSVQDALARYGQQQPQQISQYAGSTGVSVPYGGGGKGSAISGSMGQLASQAAMEAQANPRSYTNYPDLQAAAAAGAIPPEALQQLPAGFLSGKNSVG